MASNKYAKLAVFLVALAGCLSSIFTCPTESKKGGPDYEHKSLIYLQYRERLGTIPTGNPTKSMLRIMLNDLNGHAQSYDLGKYEAERIGIASLMEALDPKIENCGDDATGKEYIKGVIETFESNPPIKILPCNMDSFRKACETEYLRFCKNPDKYQPEPLQ